MNVSNICRNKKREHFNSSVVGNRNVKVRTFNFVQTDSPKSVIETSTVTCEVPVGLGSFNRSNGIVFEGNNASDLKQIFDNFFDEVLDNYYSIKKIYDLNNSLLNLPYGLGYKYKKNIFEIGGSVWSLVVNHIKKCESEVYEYSKTLNDNFDVYRLFCNCFSEKLDEFFERMKWTDKLFCPLYNIFKYRIRLYEREMYKKYLDEIVEGLVTNVVDSVKKTK